jgi:hypothetical protein
MGLQFLVKKVVNKVYAPKCEAIVYSKPPRLPLN